jgi:hypothetical protein
MLNNRRTWNADDRDFDRSGLIVIPHCIYVMDFCAALASRETCLLYQINATQDIQFWAEWYRLSAFYYRAFLACSAR